MRKLLLFFVASLTSIQAVADDFVTNGDGTTWNFSRLAQTEGAGVTREVQGDTEVFTMTKSITIAEADSFSIDGGITVLLGDAVRLTLQGGSSLAAATPTRFCSLRGNGERAYGIRVEGTRRVCVSQLIFEEVGLVGYVEEGMDIAQCQFIGHNAASASYAVNMGPDGSSYRITDCTFSECQRSAIGSGANIRIDLRVEDCDFDQNGVSNANYPQLNLTVGDSVVIRNNHIKGHPDHTMVGGIVVANMMNYPGRHVTLIENNTIEGNRFGLATYLPQEAVIRNNCIKDNNTEVTPMNGGSGINIYDPYYQQNARVEGNLIEGNLWGITVIGGHDINIGKTDNPLADDYNPGANTFFNNGFDHQIYDLYNNSTNTVYAQGNYWKTASTQDEEGIEQVIYHRNDNPELGEVVFSPWSQEDMTLVRSLPATGQASPVAIYDQGGVRRATLQKGINIVKRDGRVVKILR